MDREVDDHALPIQHGRFYTQDDYPDLELFHTTAMLVRRRSPPTHPHFSLNCVTYKDC